MVLEITRSLLGEIRSHAALTYPEECCGIMTGTDDGARVVSTVIRTANIAPSSRKSRYSISPADILAAERQSKERSQVVIGFYHSHPDYPSVPSEFDRGHAWPMYSYLIVRVIGGSPGQARSWRLESPGGKFREEAVNIR